MMCRQCPSCNEGQIVDTKTWGRRMPFRNIPDLEFPADLEVPTCNACGEEWLDAESSARIDNALKRAYQAALPMKVEAALTRLADAGITQQQLERLLGLSVGYISKLKSGKETSPQLVATFMLLANDPVSRVAELKQLWRTTPVCKGSALEASPDTTTMRSTVVTPMPSLVDTNLRRFKKKEFVGFDAETFGGPRWAACR